MEKLRGYDRRPTDEEALGPPDQRPWTEYDGRGDKQLKPPFKALGVGPCLCFGPTCCVLELQWPEWLCNRPSFEPGDCYGGPDADRCCDVCCRCQTERMLVCGCCGPQCNDCLPDWLVKFCGNDNQSMFAGFKQARQECCACDCIENNCSWRYGGVRLCCLHCSCVKCSPCCGCTNCCCCEEEIIYMDGDLKPMSNLLMEMR